MEEHELQRMKKYQSYFQEMAFSRSKIEQEIRSSNRNRAEHFILLYFFPKDQSVKHWQSEIEADILDIAEMKWSVNKKYLSSKEYFDNLWNMPFENSDDYSLIDKYIKSLIGEGYDIPKNWAKSKSDIVNRMISLYLDLAEHLNKGDVTRIKAREIMSVYNKSIKINEKVKYARDQKKIYTT